MVKGNPQVIDYITAKMYLGASPVPDGWTLAHDKVVQNASGSTGVLLRCDNTGIYRLYCAGIFASIDQRFAASIATTV